MDYRERKRLEDEINRGVRNVGIYKVDEGALERENRSPIVIGGGIGLGIGGPLAIGYLRQHGFYDRSPLGLFQDDYVLAAFGIAMGATLLGALIAWGLRKVVPRRKKLPKGTPGAAAQGKTGQLTDSK